MASDHQDLLQRLGVDIDAETLLIALTHRSYAYEHAGQKHNERLEFLGDSVLGLTVTDEIFTRYPERSEGDLARYCYHAAGAVAVAANLNGVTGLTLDAPTLAAIYQGRITRWSDAALAALNPGVTLPDTPIVAVHRGDGSGSTNALSLWLAAFSPDWAGGPGVGPQLTWPGGQAADGSRGMIAALTATPGAIGYVEAGQARRAGLTVAALRNAAGQAVLPDAPGLRAALSAVEWAAPAPDAMARAAAPEARPPELGGRDGPEPVRYGDWERKGVAVDF